ncbi:MAG: hypothetical protein GEV08_00745 [Acidimicrobiia bacterium]|nr:hypothetical protein [Acidimicrobiia bacterium]
MKRSRRAQQAQRRRAPGAAGGRGKANRAEEARRFWGDRAAVEEPAPAVRPTPDASALVRSLGPPPLVGHDRAAEAYFAAVYDRAVGLAAALAAASGLLQAEGDGEDDPGPEAS